MVSYVRKTHYGESFQVRSEPKPSHLAYTPVELDFHTDLNYRESSPGIQVSPYSQGNLNLLIFEGLMLSLYCLCVYY